MEALEDELQFCGCVETEAIISIIVKLMQDFENKIDYKHRSLSFDSDAALYYLIVDKLEHLDFIEHGTSIRFPWLTQKGKDWLASFLKEKNDRA